MNCKALLESQFLIRLKNKLQDLAANSMTYPDHAVRLRYSSACLVNASAADFLT
jgi:hypothetical protein